MKGDEFLRHRERDTREIESAAHYVAAGTQENANLGDALEARIERAKAEGSRLRAWAQEHGKLGGEFPLEQGGGHEHIVNTSRVDRDGRVEKATRPETELGYGALVEDKGATPGEYLFRLAQQNWIFGDAVRLERIVPVGGNKLSIVTSQPFIDAPDATLPEIDDFMVNTKGFERVGHGAYYDRQERILHWQTPRSALSSLQRGRAPRSAESSTRASEGNLGGLASTEPRSEERGKPSILGCNSNQGLRFNGAALRGARTGVWTFAAQKKGRFLY